VHLRIAGSLLLCASGLLAAQSPLPGYTPANAARERSLESDAIKRPSATLASEYSRELSKETHVAGTAAQARTRDYVIAQMKQWGIETDVRAYDV
jgi:N-acetylated-alpha-linked acidic dipeptidase